MDLDTDNKVLVLLGWLPYLLEGTMTESEIETATMTESEIETATMTESEIETTTGLVSVEGLSGRGQCVTICRKTHYTHTLSNVETMKQCVVGVYLCGFVCVCL